MTVEKDPSHQIPNMPQAQATKLFEYLLTHHQQSPQETIFVNRNLRMEKIKYVGFDLDWTLAYYNREPLDKLTFELTIERLIEHLGYPTHIRKAEFIPEFSQRGLLLDKVAGTVIKMDRHRYVGLAYFGRDQLDTEERFRLYRQERIDLTRERFYHVDTLFELPEVNLFSELIELKKKSFTLPSNEKLFSDIRKAVDSIHADTTLKSRILAEPETFLPKDTSIALTLSKLSLGGRKLILITNSEMYYTAEICSYLLNDSLPGLTDWRQLFDLVIVSAQKPYFFRKARPFVPIDEKGQEAAPVVVPEWKKAYSFGSREGLMSLLGTLGEHVLYIGDHIYGDIRWSRVSSAWRTTLIVRELEDEIRYQNALSLEAKRLTLLQTELRRLGHRLDLLRDEYDLARLALSPSECQTDIQCKTEDTKDQHGVLRTGIAELQQRINATYNPFWGSVFKQGSSKSLFANQVDDFADLYTPHIKNFLDYGNSQYFRVVTDPMPHETMSV